MRVAVILLFFLSVALACDIIVHLKSDTDKKFSGQIVASNGKKSERFVRRTSIEKLCFLFQMELFEEASEEHLPTESR